MKVCCNSECRETDRKQFTKNVRGKFGLSDYCKRCIRQRQLAGWDKYRAAHFLRTYQLTAAALRKLGKTCRVCRSKNRLQVDHDHACCPGTRSCGKCVRGLLCPRCNRALGLFRDSPTLLERAAHYLREKGRNVIR